LNEKKKIIPKSSEKNKQYLALLLSDYAQQPMKQNK